MRRLRMPEISMLTIKKFQKLIVREFRYLDNLRRKEVTMRGKKKNSKYVTWEQRRRGQNRKLKSFEKDVLDIGLPPTIEIIRKLYRSPELKDLVRRMTEYADLLSQKGNPKIPTTFLREAFKTN
jgi:hypothetical protein